MEHKAAFPHIKRENILPNDKLMYYLASRDNHRNDFELSREVKCLLYSKIIDGEIEYGNIPSNYVLPYLRMKNNVHPLVENIVIPSYSCPKIEYINQLIGKNYLQSSPVKKAILDFFKYKQFGENYNKTLDSDKIFFSIESYDDFPLITIITNGIHYISHSYGIANIYSSFYVRILYGLEPKEYINYYMVLNDTKKKLLSYSIISENLTPFLRYMENPTSINSIINLPEIEQKIVAKNGHLLEDKYRAPKLTYGGRSKILKLAEGKLEPNLLKLLNLSDLVIESLDNPVIKELIESNPELKYGGVIGDYILDYLRPRSIKFIAGMERYRGDKPLQYLKDNWHIASHSRYLREQTHKPLELIRYSEYGWLALEYNCAVKRFKVNFDQEITPDVCITICIACNMMDYGLPGKDESHANPYPINLTKKIVTELKGTYQDGDHYTILDDLLDLERSILDYITLELILDRGYIHPLPHFTDFHLERYEKWKRFDETKKSMLRSLYGHNFNAHKYIFIQSIFTRAEWMIDQYDPDILDAQMLSYGMIKPDNISSLDYFTSSLHLYSDENYGYMTSGGWPALISGLDVMTDLQLIDDIFGGYIGHTSREDLIDKARDNYSGSESFVLMKNRRYPFEEREELYKYISEPPSEDKFNLLFRYNQSKFFGEPVTISELDVMNRDIILDDDSGEFMKETKIYIYTDKKDSNGVPITKSMSESGLYMFKQTMMHAKNYYIDLKHEDDIKVVEDDETLATLNYLLKRVDIALIQSKSNYIKERETADRFLRMQDTSKELILKGLVAAFDCGMIQRQWKGVRGEYPYTREQAGTEEQYETKKDLLVGKQLHILNDVFEELTPGGSSFLENLRIVALEAGSNEESFIYEIYRNGEGDINFKTLRMLYDDISKGENNGGLCIRIGSAKFIWTAYYWLKLFGRVDILGKFDVSKVTSFG